MYIITAKHKGNKITRKAFIGMKEENHTEGEK